jgi:serine/threonine protein kinase/CheY-like chemotaxis protein
MSKGDLFIVDDNANNLGLLAGILRDGGYTVRMANNGRRAIAAVRRQPPELILLDINMPDISGYAVCDELKRDPRTERVPIIFLSALDDVKDKVNAFRIGGVDYITKPFHAEEVLARVASQLQLARLRGSVEERNRELAERNAELLAAQRFAEQIFATLAAVLPGTILDDKYRIGGRLGAGGFAVVYRGEALADGRPVAVKVLRPQPGGDERHRDRVRIEELSAIRIRHPCAVAVLDSGVTAAGIAYLVMELLEGHSLAVELATRGPLPFDRAARLLLPVAEALAEAHAANVIHRDVKPGNIFLHMDGVKLVDFGIAKIGEIGVDQATTMGRLLGTPVYMPPERLLGHAYDGGADVYALAMTLYEALAGKLPFPVAPGAALGAIIVTCLHESPRPLAEVLPGVAAPVADLVMRALDKDRTRRPTMAELAAGLAAAAGLPTAPAPAPAPVASSATLDSPLR